MQKNEPTPIEAIDFKSLQNKNAVDARQKPSVVNKSALWLAFLFLIVCGVGVFLFLPKYVAENPAPTPAPAETIRARPQAVEPPEPPEPPESIAQETPSLSTQEISALKSQTEQLLLQVIKKQETLQQQGIKKWAADDFLHAISLGAAGDEHFRKQNFTAAVSSYQQAITALEHLEQQVAPTLAKHLQQGELALTQGERDAAIHHFQFAKAIDAQNMQALNGLQRAETIEELFALLEKGGNFDAANHLQDARQTYQQAIDLDPLSAEAKTAINRVSKRLTDIEFSRLIALGYSLFRARQFEDARSTFMSAQKLSPGSDQPKQGLAKVVQAIRDEKILSLTIEAQHFAANEEWAYALQSYQQILALSPNAAFAVAGVAYSQQRAELVSRLDHYLDNEERLYATQVATEAHQLLAEITLMDNPGNNIADRATALEELLKLASQPVSITLQSDNQTDVVIFKVGKFGRFENQKIQLKPGKYTVLGSRPGYRDVRKILTVSPYMQTKNFMVQCEEAI